MSRAQEDNIAIKIRDHVYAFTKFHELSTTQTQDLVWGVLKATRDITPADGNLTMVVTRGYIARWKELSNTYAENNTNEIKLSPKVICPDPHPTFYRESEPLRRIH